MPGATLAGPRQRRATFRARLQVMQGMHHKLATVSDPVFELKLAVMSAYEVAS